MAHHGNANGGIPAIHRTYFNLQEISEPTNLTIDAILRKTGSGSPNELVTDEEYVMLGEWIANHTEKYPLSTDIPRQTEGLYRIEMVENGYLSIQVPDRNSWDSVRGASLEDSTAFIYESVHGDKTLKKFKSESYGEDIYLIRTVFKIEKPEGTPLIVLALYQRRGFFDVCQ